MGASASCSVAGGTARGVPRPPASSTVVAFAPAEERDEDEFRGTELFPLTGGNNDGPGASRSDPVESDPREERAEGAWARLMPLPSVGSAAIGLSAIVAASGWGFYYNEV